MDQLQYESLSRELSALRRENRLIKLAGALCLAMALIAVSTATQAQTSEPNTVRARKFILEDASGRQVGELAVVRYERQRDEAVEMSLSRSE